MRSWRAGIFKAEYLMAGRAPNAEWAHNKTTLGLRQPHPMTTSVLQSPTSVVHGRACVRSKGICSQIRGLFAVLEGYSRAAVQCPYVHIEFPVLGSWIDPRN